MIRGSCLCGGVQFEIARAVGPFELCHCRRCRKVSGSAFLAGLGVMRDDFRMLTGRELIACYEAPIIHAPPPYLAFFCRRCGSPTPDPEPSGEWLEIPAGLLDDDPGIRPDKHIFIEHRAPWHEVTDGLPQYDRASLIELRARTPRPRSGDSD